MNAPDVDFGRAAADYAAFRQGFPAEFFRRLDGLGIGIAGQRVADLGTGTGLLARAFAARGCRVTGVDPSASMLAEARNAAPEIEWVEARAEATGLTGGGFDVVSAATCWHWFDRAAAAHEAARLLTPVGVLLIAHLDWQCLPGNVVDASVAVMMGHADAETKRVGVDTTFRYPEWLRELVAAGFRRREVFGFTAALSYSLDAWIGRLRASAWMLDFEAERQAMVERALRTELARRFPGEMLPVDHSIFAVAAWR